MLVDKWRIWRANLDPFVGSEQGKSRPVLVISETDVNSLLNTINIIPITSRKPNRVIYPNEALLSAPEHGLENESIALCHQIGTIDKKRLSKKYGQVLSSAVQVNILGALSFQLGIEL